MPDVKYERETNTFDVTGLDLNRPLDSIKPGKFPYLKNCRSYQFGRLEARGGLTDIAEVVAGQAGVHSCRRLNDVLNQTFTRIIGTGTHLAYGQNSFTDLDSGYSGQPLALQPWRPEASPNGYMYVADTQRMRKVAYDGTNVFLDTIGYAAPLAPPSVAVATPNYKAVDEFNATAGLAQAGTAGAPGLISRTPGGASGSTTTIAQILYDTGSTGWASVNLTSMVGVTYGERLTFDPAGTPEIATVQAVYPVSVATTISRIIYDSGTTGACSLILATPIENVYVDALIRNTTVGPENARIVAVSRGPDGHTSIRISTTNTWAATNAVQILATLRVFTTATYAAAATVMNDAITSAVTVGTGTLTRAGALDLSLLSTGNPVHGEDYMHIAMRVDNPSLITELKVQLDVDATTNDFTRNFYTRSFRPSDLTPNVQNLQSSLATRSQAVQNEIIASAPVSSGGFGSVHVSAHEGKVVAFLTTPSTSPITASQELESGQSQWVPLRFHINELTRVGTDDTRTLANVASIRIVIICTGTVNVDLDSWWIGGGDEPDTGDVTAIPYQYRYRVRNPETNVASNFSPATRLTVEPLRQSVNVTMTQYAAPSGTNLTTADFVLDIERFGGQIPEWHYVGTTANSASPSFIDKYPDIVVAANPSDGNTNYQPWPTIGDPVTASTAVDGVAGTTIQDSGTNFNTSWAPGTRILINNEPFTIYRVLSTSKLEVVENAGSQSSVTWRIDEPVLLAQNMPCLWQWDNRFWACGDPTNPGRIYFSNPNSETTVQENYYDITSPSEPLQNGLQYNVRGYVFSSESMIQLLETGNAEDPYRWEFIPNGKGMFSRWFLCREPSPFIFFGGKDGIYVSTGGSPTSLTDSDLYPLLPNEGGIGSTTNGISAPNWVVAQQTNLRLTYYDEYLYFDYVGVDTNRASLVLAFDAGALARGEALGGWFWDVYSPGGIFHYGEEGSGVHSLLVGMNNGHIEQYTAGTADAGTAFSMEFTTPSRDQNEPRANKLYGDIMLDANTAGLNVTATPFFNNNASSVAAVTVNTASRILTTIPLTSTSWQTFRNISLNCVVSITGSARPTFYIWEPRWTFESAPIAALSWEISPTTFGMPFFKHIGLCRITHVSSANLSLTFTVDGVAQAPITITNSGSVYTQTVFRVPVMKGKIFKIRLSSTTDFRLDTRDTYIEVKSWNFDGPNQKLRVFGDYSMIEG